MISFNNVHKAYGINQVLRGLTFEVPDGSVTGIVGPNGSGKTTALRILSGLLSPDQGTALVDGLPYRGADDTGRTLGAFLGHSTVPATMTGAGYLRYVADLLGAPRQRVLTYLDLVGLSAASNLPIAGYSLGMRQRLGLASALIGEARTLVLDEPVNGLDIEGVKWMRDYLRSSAQSGRCILLSSHLLSELELVADRLVILADGVASRVGTLESLRADDAPSVLITCVDPAELLPHFIAAGAEAIPEPGQLRILGRDLSWVAGVVSTAPVQVTGILQSTRGIEEVYLEETAHAGSHLMNVEGLR
ncbi:MAG: ABC transporter ATP-binding protein [Dermatophilaceae bacterium]|nr:ABC transporter ATP-binding protein [Actinomycetales bacterium]MBP8880946.1 ABC transporter ATP-binding protein [Dermatophilaceae bacterium]MBP9919110.1 ABC transporter ATP-binding protein [Dermatophilaceae bacterium]